MSAIAFANVKYVQHTFDWDAPAVQTPRSTAAVCTVQTPESKSPMARASAPERTAAPERAAAPGQASLRRGRCEHVGGVMAVVLNKYGLGIDDLLRAIEERQAQAKVPSR